MKQEVQKPYGHAIVIGGSYAGLFTARVLSNYFNKVTMLEKDTLNAIEQHQTRDGVPQRNNLHNLWPLGARALENFFPNFSDALIKKGAKVASYPEDAKVYDEGWKPRLQGDSKKTFLSSRLLLDDTMRDLNKENSTIESLYHVEVRGLICNFKEKKITGVHILNKDSKEESNLYGDLIVDASGYNTMIPTWFETLGYGKPRKTEVKTNVYDISQYYRLPESLTKDWKLLRIKGKGPKIGIVIQVEDNPKGKMWELLMSTESGDTLNFEDSQNSFVDAMKKLDSPEIYELIQKGEAVSPPFCYKFPAGRRYHYEEMTHLPSGFISIGDASFATNPRQGLGLTNVALSLELLDTIFSENNPSDLNKITRQYITRVAQLRDQIWPLTVNNSLAFPQNEGERPFGLSLKNWYMRSINQIATKDPEVWRSFWSVLRLEEPYKSLFRWRILYKVLLHSITTN